MNLTRAAKGIEYWFRFYQTIGKSDLLNEDSIKYPLLEYLIADGDDSLKNIKLEDSHPVFLSREVDLISKKDGTIHYLFEFKMASKITMAQQERQMIFDDIARLYYARKIDNKPAYLVVAGKTVDFLSEFRSVVHRNPGKRGRRKKADAKPTLALVHPSGFFSDRWLSFDMESPIKEIDIKGEVEVVYKNHYDKFKNEYLVDDYATLPLADSIKTKLQYITEITEKDTTGDVPAMVGIWEIDL